LAWGKRVRIGLWAILVLVVAELLLIVVLSWSPSGEKLEPLAIGEIVEPLMLTTLEGEPLRVDYPEGVGATVLMVFSPDCPACRENMGNWKKTVAEQAGEGSRFYYVSNASAERTRRYVEPFDLRAPVLLGSPEELKGLRIRLIPRTIAIAPGGGVRGTWIGAPPQGAL
jgi:hypothetical protein